MPYDPYREGADFVCGYPFSLRTGVPCGVSCGLWFNLSDIDARCKLSRQSRGTLLPALRIAEEGRVRWETLEDVWNERGDAVESLRKKWERMKLMEKSDLFFASLKLPESAVTVEDCVVEVAKAVREQLGSDDPAFTQAADAMVKWVQLWSEINSSG
ncbi:BnaC02g06660D [Brassica napus]|uniref:BnaC02g06660D protein n=1 Tax=Brassica napus TaxID=3708 RepID=A0A078HJS1_BRANA|nr:BnaC02g06660D [Brassica napus]